MLEALHCTNEKCSNFKVLGSLLAESGGRWSYTNSGGTMRTVFLGSGRPLRAVFFRYGSCSGTLVSGETCGAKITSVDRALNMQMPERIARILYPVESRYNSDGNTDFELGQSFTVKFDFDIVSEEGAETVRSKEDRALRVLYDRCREDYTTHIASYAARSGSNEVFEEYPSYPTWLGRNAGYPNGSSIRKRWVKAFYFPFFVDAGGSLLSIDTMSTRRMQMVEL